MKPIVYILKASFALFVGFVVTYPIADWFLQHSPIPITPEYSFVQTIVILCIMIRTIYVLWPARLKK